MKWTGVVFLALLDSCVAQKWKLVGCGTILDTLSLVLNQVADLLLEKYNGNGLVTEAITQAIALARSGNDVLNNNFNDPKVQSMLRHILGDGAELQTNVDKMKGK